MKEKNLEISNVLQELSLTGLLIRNTFQLKYKTWTYFLTDVEHGNVQ